MKPVRRSQVIAPFGIGAMVDFPGPVSLIHAGLDAWPYDASNPDHEEFRFEEERLAKRLGVDHFVLPPDYRVNWGHVSSDDPNLNIKLPFLRFPTWHTCPTCGLMHKSEYHDKTSPPCYGTNTNPHNRRGTVQVRFIAICPSGHLQDFPWYEWVLNDSNPDTENTVLRMRSGGSASLSGIKISCENSVSGKIIKKKSLAGAFDNNAFTRLGVKCDGHNPSLAIPSSNYPAQGCGNDLFARLKGGGDVYYSNYKSSIYLPPVVPGANEEALAIIDDPRIKGVLGVVPEVTEEFVSNILKRYYPESSVTPAEFISSLQSASDSKYESIIIDSDDEEQNFRREEYRLLSQDVVEGFPKVNLLIKSENIKSYSSVIADNFERVSLVHKLRETRAFTGFSRIYDNLTLDEKWKLIAHEKKSWLPATIVRGEGIFIQFKEEKIQQWMADHKEKLDERTNIIQLSYDSLAERRHQDSRIISPRIMLLHSLSHILINQLIYDCGYGSASLRERLYYSDDKDNPMAGFLIYTSAGDSEGTMGGLVRMGYPGRLEYVLKRALESAQWCSSDPVCIESRGQGPDNCNLAACHACSLLPETSCEKGNRILDRAVVVGDLLNRKLGFMSDYLCDERDI